jgi:cysteine desulfurase
MLKPNPPDHPIYLDNAATTPLAHEVLAAMHDCAATAFANPASQHAAGRAARRTLEDAKEEIARLLGAQVAGMRSDRLIVTSGGTESNNLLLTGLAHGRMGRIVLSAIEHPSVMEMGKVLSRRGYDVQHARVNQQGQLDLDHFRSLIDSDTILASAMLGNNETGVIQPVAEAAEICAAAEVDFHCDATQAVGKTPVDFRALGVSAMTAAPHKFHGPRGMGVLLLREQMQLEPMLHGGFQQLGFRPGTESVMLVVGMLRALQWWQSNAAELEQLIGELRDRLEAALLDRLPDLLINGAEVPRLPHVSNLAFLGLDRQALVMALDMAGVACSTGSACASGSSEPSPTLLAMGREKAVVGSSLRFSLGAFTTAAEIDSAVERISKVVNELRSRQ